MREGKASTWKKIYRRSILRKKEIIYNKKKNIQTIK